MLIQHIKLNSLNFLHTIFTFLLRSYYCCYLNTIG